MAVSSTANVARRRVLFGLNVAVQVVLAAAVVVALIWLGDRLRLTGDWTSGGINTLSPATAKLLRNLDQNIRITCLFAKPDEKRDPLASKRWREMSDLLALYDSVGGARVSTHVLDPSLQKAETDTLLERLRKLPAYQDEAKAHQEALEKFLPLNDQIRNLASQDHQTAEQAAQNNPALAKNRNFGIVRNNLRLAVREADKTAADLEELKNAEVPRYGQAVREMREYLSNIRLLLVDMSGWMSADALALPDLTPDARAFFEQSTERYQPLIKEMDALIEATRDLQEVKLETIHSELTRWRSGPPVLVESEREAKVVSFADLWKRPPEPGAPIGPEGEDRLFMGEEAISSAILHLTQKEKTAVIFTHYRGPSPIRPDFSQMDMTMRQMPTAPCQALAEALEKANFLTEDWDVSKEKTPPTVEGATRTVYVIFPPEPPPRPNPMQPALEPRLPPEDRQIILDAVKASGKAVFLAGWMPPESPLPGAKGSYEFAGYLRSDWGIEVQPNHLVLQFTPNPQKPGWWVPAGREPWLLTTDGAIRFADHPIGKPLQTDRAGFRLTAPLRIVPEAERPAGVLIDVIAEVRQTQDVWACDDPARFDEELRRNQGVRPADSDVRAPFPVAAAAVKDDQKLVVFGSEQFVMDSLTQATVLYPAASGLMLAPLYPANTNLFLNALHWLTGEAERIAVGPRQADVGRLTELTEEWAGRLRWFLVGIWPALALILGLGVWLVRRR